MKKILLILLMTSFLVSCGKSSENSFNEQENNKDSQELTLLYDLIESEQWEEAKEYIENSSTLPKTKDVEVLSIYVESRYDYEIQKKQGKIIYEAILSKLNEIDLESYSGEFKDEIQSFKDALNKERLDHYDAIEKERQEIQAENSKKSELEREQKITTALKKGDYGTVSEMTIFLKDDPEMDALYNYSSAMEQKGKDNDMFLYYLAEIPTSYNGIYSKEIMNEKLKYKTKEEWNYEYNKHQWVSLDLEDPTVPPRIGMTAEEVRNSTWGDPNDINKTTTAYGTSEQWVYSDFRFIYFENGVVTVIRE